MLGGTLTLCLLLLMSGILISALSRRRRFFCASLNMCTAWGTALILIPVAARVFFPNISSDAWCGEVSLYISPYYDTLKFGLDPLSLFFMYIFLVTSGLFAMSEMRKNRRSIMNSHQWTAYAALTVSVFGVLIARDSMSFLVFWEMSAIAVFVLMLFRVHERIRARTAWLWLFFSHLSLLMLCFMFAMIKVYSGSSDFSTSIVCMKGFSPEVLSGLFIPLLIGFGAKAGLFPFHFWVPSAHETPPLPMSGLMTAAGLNLGLYGFLRFGEPFFHNPETWWGVLVLLIGLLTLLSGGISAVMQENLKRVCGLTAVSHVGLIMMAFGLLILTSYYVYPGVSVMILCGIILHIFNLSFIQPLLMLSVHIAGEAAGSCDINQGGGLIRRLPFVGFAYLNAALSSCMLPPFSGFIPLMLFLLASVRLLVTPNLPPLLLFAVILTTMAMMILSVILMMTHIKSFGLFFTGIPRHVIQLPLPPTDTVTRLALWMQTALIAFLLIFFPFLLILLPEILSSFTSLSSCGVWEEINQFALNAVLFIWLGSLLLIFLTTVAYFTVRMITKWSGKTEIRTSFQQGFLPPAPQTVYSGFSFSKLLTDMLPGIVPDPPPPFPDTDRFPTNIHYKATPEIKFQEWVFIVIPEWINRLAVRIQSIQNGRIHFYIFSIIAILLILLGVKYL